QVVVPEVKECDVTPLVDSELTRLPKNQTEGDIPRIALTTGNCDNLGCMLPKIGIDASEFGNESDGPNKAVHVSKDNNRIQGTGVGPPGATIATDLWADAAKMKQYDMLILSCECYEALDNKGGGPDGAAFGAMTNYLAAGGRIFTTDYQYVWYRYSPDA